MRILLGVSGSVAAIKIPVLVKQLKETSDRIELKIVATSNALHFFKPEEVDAPVLTDKDEWAEWEKIGDPVLHIELCKWADICVIAPLDANTLAKISNGICDNLLTCIVRAWRFPKPLIVAPAMNTFMWDHPLTSEQLQKLTSFGYEIIQPIVKKLACEDTGKGAMAEVPTITSIVLERLEKSGL